MCEVCEGRERGEVCEACMREGQWEREGQERGREREGERARCAVRTKLVDWWAVVGEDNWRRWAHLHCLRTCFPPSPPCR